jgi:c-di-GMP-binding flagellar brake protein YcgR
MSEPDQRRQHPRFAVELDATIDTAEGTVLGRTRDVSLGGFCLLAQVPLPIGEACTVHLALVFPEGQFSEHLTLPATVVWCTQVKAHHHQIGVKFEPLDPQSKNYLDLFMRFLEAPEGDEEEASE